MWIFAIFLAFTIYGFFTGAREQTSSAGYYLLLAINAGLTSLFWLLAKKSNRIAELHGSVLSFTEDGWHARKWSVDTSRITEIHAGFWGRRSMPLRAQGPYWVVVTDDGKRTTVEFSFYSQADRDLFLPLITDIVQRSHIILKGGSDVTQVLKAWFGTKAPIPVAQIQ